MNQPSLISRKNVGLVVVIVCIIAAIWYIDASKPPRSTTAPQSLSQSAYIASSSSAGTAATALSTSTVLRLATKAKEYPPGEELADIQGYINSPVILPDGTASSTAPFTLASLVEKKVVLIDFWTYSCINCLRTIPYLNAWYQKYKDQGLEIIGVHTPEFDFEKNYANVAAAVQRLGIQYPVVLDSNQGTWNAYQNMYWPHEFLIDIDGFIVHDHIGEGGYAETEQAIQAALTERDKVLGLPDTVPTGIVNPSDVISMDPSGIQSPETYFGAERNEYLGNGTQGVTGLQSLTLPATFSANTLYLGGSWNFADQFAQNTSSTADIVFNYNSKNVYFVAAAATSSAPSAANANAATNKPSVKIKIFIDGQPISPAQAGSDVSPDGTATVSNNRLYSLVNGTGYGEHTLHIQVEGAGLDAFTFTFG